MWHPFRKKTPNKRERAMKEMPAGGRTCATCGKQLSDTAWYCQACNSWVEDNPVFLRLCKGDIEKIKSKQLMPATPSLLSFQVTEFFQQDIAWLNQVFDRPKVEHGYAYLSAHVHANAASFTTKKAKMEASLNEQIAIEFISNAVAAQLFDLEPCDSQTRLDPPVQRSSRDPRVRDGLRVFKLLDKARDGLPWNLGTADMARYAKEIERIILGHSVSIVVGTVLMKLETSWTDLMNLYMSFFVLEEEDLPWESDLFGAKGDAILEKWLARFR